jgi:hypothetical protein
VGGDGGCVGAAALHPASPSPPALEEDKEGMTRKRSPRGGGVCSPPPDVWGPTHRHW